MCNLMSVCSRDTLDKTFKGMRGQAFILCQSDLKALFTYKPGILSPPAVSFRDCRSFHQNQFLCFFFFWLKFIMATLLNILYNTFEMS